MKLGILLLALFLCHWTYSQFLEEPCGTTVGPRINNGQDAKINSSIWMAAIFNLTHFQCGGTLIHFRFILTAAHCMDSGYKLYVNLGAYNKSSYTFRQTVSQQIKHPEYNYWSKKNDIGLLKLSNSVDYNGK
ncbi:vitamin K-dependent protein C [Drosophila takahashii]|uniref:vitamin K-dependent protein C n=1 Tax=Drosophila takahashii TaxID=29030 RepID=UPI0007E5E903